MRFPKPRRREVRSEQIILTGGLNEIVSTLELGKGELIQCLNYMETDGPFHGYTSTEGFEVYDGKAKPSDIPALLLETLGMDDDTVLLIEAADYTDVSKSSHTIGNFGVTSDSTNLKFQDYSFRSNAGYLQVHSLDAGQFSTAFSSAFSSSVTGVQSFLNLGSDWTLDIQVRPATTSGVQLVFEKPDCYKLELLDGGLLKFSISSDGTSYDYTLTQEVSALNIYQFVHVSIACSSLQVSMAINGTPIATSLGVQIQTTVPSINTTTSDLYIGDASYNGWWDEFRISVVTRWINPFTAPTERYTTGAYTEINWDDRLREIQRGTIEEVPGAADSFVLGIHMYEGELYALRNKDGINAALYKALVTGDDSTAGWTLIDDTFNVDGKLEAFNWSFTGQTTLPASKVMLIVDGKSIPRVWDGTTMRLFDESGVGAPGPYLPDNQATPRYATHVSMFDNRVLFAYAEDDLVLSPKDDIFDFSLGYGSQLNIGDTVTNLRELPGETMAVICRNSTKILEKLEVPTSTASAPDYTFRVRNHSTRAGGIDNTCERLLDKILYADDRGIVDFFASDKYGDFEAAAISKKVNRIYLSNKSLVSASMVDRSLNQYRLFFSNGTALYFTYQDDKLKGATFLNFGLPVVYTCEGEDLNGEIVKYFTSENGFVYELDSGTSFNGEDIITEMFTSYYHYKSPRHWKQFMRMMFEITASRGTIFGIRNVFDYNSEVFPETQWEDSVMKGVGTSWGEGNWGEFVWGGAVIQRITQYIRGHGTNMSIEVMTSSKYNSQHTLHNVIVDYQQENIQE